MSELSELREVLNEFEDKPGRAGNITDRERRLYIALATALERLDRVKPILDRRKQQDEKWGIQSHPNEWWYPILGEELGEIGKAMLEGHFDYPDANEEGIRHEVIDVAAVALAWLEDIDKQAAQGGRR